MIRCIIGVCLKELLLLLDSFIQESEDIVEGVYVLNLSHTISSQDFLHYLIEEVVTELAHCNSATFFYKVVDNMQEAD